VGHLAGVASTSMLSVAQACSVAGVSCCITHGARGGRKPVMCRDVITSSVRNDAIQDCTSYLSHVCVARIGYRYAVAYIRSENKSSPKSFGKSASLPLTAEIGLARFMCY